MIKSTNFDAVGTLPPAVIRYGKHAARCPGTCSVGALGIVMAACVGRISSVYSAKLTRIDVLYVLLFCTVIVNASAVQVGDFDDSQFSGDGENSGDIEPTADWDTTMYDYSDFGVNDTRWNFTPSDTTSLVVSASNVSRDDAASRDVMCGYVIRLSESFLENVIQTKYLTEMADDVNLEDLKDTRHSLSDKRSAWTTYFTGYCISVILIAVIVVIVSVVGVTVSCCRCRGHCGGNVHPLEGKHARCLRVCCICAIFLFTCLAVVFVVCSFVYNERVRYQLRKRGGFADEISRGFSEIDAFLDRAVTSLHVDVIDTFDQYTAAILSHAMYIPNDVEEALVNISDMHATQHKLHEFENELTGNVVNNLTIANYSIGSLQAMASMLHVRLKQLKVNLTNSLVNVSANNETLGRISLLGVGSNFSDIDVSSALTMVNHAIVRDTIGKTNNWISTAIDTFRSSLDDEIRSVVQDVEEEADIVRLELVNLIHDVGKIARQLNLKDAAENVQKAKSSISLYSAIVYSFMMVTSVIIGIVLFCKLIGLLYGALCRRTGTYEMSHSCEARRTTGATWLLASVGLTALFCAFVLAVACALFVAAGMAHTEVCRHLMRPNSPKSARVLRVMNDLLNSSVFGAARLEVNLTRLYARCEQDAPLYDAADMLHRAHGMADMRSVKDAIRRFATLPLAVQKIQRLDIDAEEDIARLKRSLELLDIRDLRRRLASNVSFVDLSRLSRDLMELANDTSADITDCIAEIQLMLRDDVVYIQNAKMVLQQTFRHLSTSLSQFPVSGIFAALNLSESVLEERANSVVFETANRSVVMALHEVNAAQSDITNLVLAEGARCRPMYESMSRMVNVTCAGIVAPLNGFWFSIAVCMLLLLLPCATPLSLALATQLRKTERHHTAAVFCYENAYDAYRISDYSPAYEQSRDRLVMKAPSRERLDSVDNPVYLMESNVPPRLAHAEQPCPPGYPRYGASARKASPPPSYESSAVDDYENLDDDDRSTYDTRL